MRNGEVAKGAKSGHVAKNFGSFSDPPNFSSLLLSPLVVAVVVVVCVPGVRNFPLESLIGESV